MRELRVPAVLRRIFLCLLLILFMLPVFSLVQTSFDVHGFENYWVVLTQIDIQKNVWNSTVVTFFTVLSVVAVTLPAAFAFSKLRFPLQNALFVIILLAMMIPGITIMLPVLQIVKAFGWINHYPSLIFPYIALSTPFALVLAKGFLDQLPKELLEAAVVEGATVFKSFRMIYVPLARPVLAIIIVFTFLSSWNEFLFAMIFMKKESMQMVTTIPIAFQDSFRTDVPKLFASLVVIELPVFFIYLLFQKSFREGLTAGAVK